MIILIIIIITHIIIIVVVIFNYWNIQSLDMKKRPTGTKRTDDHFKMQKC